MRILSKLCFGASLVALIVTAPTALAAQDEMPGEAVELTAEQQAMFDNWPPDKQFAYSSWPSATKNYYWSLSSTRQKLFWRLSDEDKIAVTAMTGPERDAAWKSIEESAQKPKAKPPADGPGDAPPVK